MSTIFQLSFLLVFPFWALMIFAPRWTVTRRVMASPFVAIGPVLIYALLVVPDIASILPLVARPELDTIAALLGTSAGATIAWQHFLAFDLLIAQRIHADAIERGTPVWLLSPIILLTLLLGPLGWLAHLVVRSLGRARG
jgi:hypothetical protein